jgi:hypothetical protein
MMEICPAGPPKLMKPSLSQKMKASRKLTWVGGEAGASVLAGIGIFFMAELYLGIA